MTAAAEPSDASGLRDRAEQWARSDPDPTTAEQVRAALADGDDDSIGRWFGPRLNFGTAGIRGPMMPGPAGIGRLVARQTAQGWARWVVTGHGVGATVVIGHDGRHLSAEMARDAAEIATAEGLNVDLVDRPAATPFMAWLAREDDRVGAMVVTASHNPPRDNGIKVYDADGAQIIPPVDSSIAAAIESAMADPTPSENVTGTVRLVAPRRDDDFMRAAVAIAAPHGHPAIRVAVTSLHGVGDALLRGALKLAGFTDVTPVEAQRLPDPDFPTTPFPNPEEPGTLDLLVALTGEIGAHLGIANDPDADRCAIVVPPANGEGPPVALTGNQVGWLLAYRELRRSSDPRDLYCTTVVSSSLLEKMCAAAGVRFAETLTGFKWLCRPAMADPTARPKLAYEEALGYALGTQRDKDGITAAVAMADLVDELRRDGRNVWDVLDELWAQHGRHSTRQVVLRLAPGTTPKTHIDDQQLHDAFASFGDITIDRPANDVVRVLTGEGHRVALRPSGTEPKFKIYLEAVTPAAAGAAHAEATLDRLSAAAQTAVQ